ncbi:MAG TPA: excinuclease ABC subunit UvrC [candidate division Zixibacteria bacterium]|nr:excinuclease ABC subunit UvrC [candidate division Zixibacteria bacterium]
MQNEKLDIKIRNLPTSPGVYLFKNKAGNIIYIGKAKNLRNRVRTYFQSANNQTPKTARMVSGIDDLELMVTDSEIEALILEANLIKEYKPRYNVNLKDDKHFPYIKVTVQEPFPRVLIVRRLENDGNRYFGPYTNSKGMRKTVHFLTRLFKIRSCNLTIPHPTGKPQKVCLDYHIGRCDGPCENLQSREDYAELVDSVMLFLSGKGVTLLEKLRNKMSRLSDDMEFEKAAETRDQIEALESVRQKQKVDAGVVVNRDIISFARDGRYTVVVIMQIREGVLIGRQDFQLTSQPEEIDSELLGGFVKQYYNHQPNLPQEIYLPLRLDDEIVISRWLSKRLGSKVSIYTPQKGEKLKLVDLAATNARLLLDEILIQKKGYKERVSKSVQSLKDNLHLARSPRTIACVDISNTGETDAVGSLVYFSNGKPYKAGYRHFKIKEVGGQNDFAMMREVVGRYFYRLQKENGEPPDLLVVDGGKGQLSSVKKEIASLGFENQNIIGLAKRFEEVYLPGHTEPLTIPKTSPGLLLLKRIRDEAHRFAIEYNRKVRSKRTVKSALDELDGIGPKRREILLRHFGSVKKIKTASLTDLQEVKGLPWNVAEKIYKAFH